ncbi:uncharacterized protein Jhbp16 isoform X2 [Plodia interpunctella]|uniref:uncharacterized protein Jhbp16 isoform X2 n=2 Tax=Plodia interpunctella TaxID=58824 RepID=UPI002368A861|nr:uncharacterized protein LOC128670272 isoform X2 [Plodia interpunctella]
MSLQPEAAESSTICRQHNCQQLFDQTILTFLSRKNILTMPQKHGGFRPLHEASFQQGIPELGVAPFDPHHADEVVQRRSIMGVGYNLTLKDVYEGGWTQSIVTKFKTDWENGRIIYSQYFPEKWLYGDYDFNGNVFGLGVHRSGHWNLTLRDYAQTTRVKRNGAGVSVHVEIDHIGGMEIHVGNILRGNSILEHMLDRMINAAWKPGFAVIRPLINDLVSTAFTDIWSKSFRNFPIDKFIK